MTQYSKIKVKLSNSKLNDRLKSAVKHETEVTLRLSSNIAGDDKTNFPRKISLSDNSSVDIKISKTQISKIVHSCEVFGKLIEPLLKTGLPAKSLFIHLGLTATATEADAEIHKTFVVCRTHDSK